MNKKILGIRIGTILQFLLCLVLAFVIWFVVQYTNSQDDVKDAADLAVSLTSFLL